MLDNTMRIVLLFTVILLAASTVWLGAIGESGAAGIAGTLALGLCAFVFLYRFKRFKGLGFEGELWEQEMEQAAEIRKNLKSLSERVGESVYWNMGEGARWSKKDAKKLFGIVERTDQNLKALGVNSLKIEEMKRPWHKCIMRDLAWPIVEQASDLAKKNVTTLGAAIGALGNPVPPENVAEHTALVEKQRQTDSLRKILSDLVWRDDYGKVPDILRKTIDGAPGLTDDDRTAIYSDCSEGFLDIDQYAHDQTVRRPEILKL